MNFFSKTISVRQLHGRQVGRRRPDPQLRPQGGEEDGGEGVRAVPVVRPDKVGHRRHRDMCELMSRII